MNSVAPLDWNLIRTFLAVMETGSLSAAGRQMRVSQPTIGRHVTELEAQLGADLFARTARGLEPTDLAHALLPRAHGMQEAAASLSMLATGAAQEVGGTVRVTASEVFSAYVMPKILRDLLHDQPGLEVELVSSNSNENLLSREADIAVRLVRPTQNDLIMRKIGETPIGMFAHQNYLVRFGIPERFEELSDHIFLGYDKSNLIIQGMANMGIKAQPSDFRFRCDDQTVHVEAMKAAMGIGITQIMVAREQPGLVQLMPELKLPGLPVYVVAHRELRSSARVRAVYEQLAEALSLRLDAAPKS